MKATRLEKLEHRLLFAAAIVNEKLTVDGTAAADSITLNTVGSQIDLNINGADSLFNSNDVKTIAVNGLDMGDTIAVNVNRPITVVGGTGDDTINTSAGVDSIIWNSGDGSDAIDTAGGTDSLIVNGENDAENYALSAVGNSLRLTQDVGNVVMAVHGVENVTLNVLGGSDVVAVSPLAGTDVTAVNVDLGDASATPDNFSDAVIVNGPSNGTNISAMDLAGGGTRLTGFAAAITVTHADATDKMHLNLLNAIDNLTVFQTGSSGSIRRIEVDGGGESDTINVQRTAADGVVVVEPSSGNDSVNANAANLGAANVLFESSAKIGTLNVGSGGAVQIAPGGGKVLNANLVNFSPNGKLDLADNALIVDYSGFDPFASIQSQIFSGYNNGLWNASGIISSTAAGQANMGIGYAEASSIFSTFPATFKGQTIDNTSILLSYTLSGDANLDGVVNTLDFNTLAQQFNQTGQRWSQGDFNYNANVNALDFNALATSFGQQIQASPGADAAFSQALANLFSTERVTGGDLKDLA